MDEHTAYPQSHLTLHDRLTGSLTLHGLPPIAVETAPPLPPSMRRIGRLRLLAVQGPDLDKTFEPIVLLNGAPQVLRGGRAPIGDIALADPKVAGAHFDLELADGHVLLRDLDSPGGVFVAGVRIREAYLAVGQSFVVGDSELRLVSAENVVLPLAMTDHFGEVHGRSAAMRSLFCELAVLTERGDRLGVLLQGEPGTGKELVARELHAASMRGRQPFVVFAAAEVAPELAPGLLFGQARGSLPNPSADQRGCLEAADGGTLYIEDIDALAPATQTQLLRALQEGGVTRVGENSPRPVDVRLICSSRGDLRRCVAAGGFRPELYFRIAGASLTLPSLRTRDGDIEFLAEHFLRRLAASEHRTRRLGPDALAALRAHPWSNNVTGLRDAVERGYFVGDGEVIGRAELSLGKGLDRGMIRRLVAFETLFGIDHSEAVARFETLYFRHLLRTHPSKAKATRTSGMTHEGFRLALRRLKLSTPEARPNAPTLTLAK